MLQSCSGDLHVAGNLTKNPEEGKVKVTSTTEGDINVSSEWFKGGRAGPSLLFVSASKQGDSAEMLLYLLVKALLESSIPRLDNAKNDVCILANLDRVRPAAHLEV